jgi:predicted AlkP superfamily phosphohydrolase/phosphomutase
MSSRPSASPTSSPSGPPAGRRQIVFGLDAAEWTVVEQMAGDGRLPTFRRLLAAGCHGRLWSTAEILPDTVWSTIYAGRNPATFDKYFYVQYDRHRGDLRHVHDDGFTERPFWKTLSEAGRTVGVVDAVKYPVTEGLDGFMIANWGAHATKAPRASWPADLLAEADRHFGRNPVGDVDRISDTPASRRDMRDRLLRGAALRKQLLCWLVATRPVDLLFCGFSELHQVGHHFWHGWDPTHPRHAEIRAQGLADTLAEVYAAVDDTLGAVLDAAGPEVDVLVVAGHGMGPLRHASWNLPEMLDLLGYGPRPARRAAGGRIEGSSSFWRRLKKSVPGWLQYAIKERLPRRWQDELLFRWYAGSRDWQGWRAFVIPNNDTVAAIRIAVKGRDRHGLVEPGAEYRRVCDALVEALMELTDPVSGRRVVRKVSRLHEDLHGPFLADKPDLCVLWEQDFVWSAVRSPRFGDLEIRSQDSRTGSHTPYGFFIAAGPDVEPGRVLDGHSILDVAPTLLRNAGVPLPADLEGRPIEIARCPVDA